MCGYLGIAMMLIAVAVGYKVLVTASKEKGRLKILGVILSVIIIAASLLGSLCLFGKIHTKMMKCQMSEKM